MIILRVYSILVTLLMLYAAATSKNISKHEALGLWLMYIPVLVYLLNGGN